MTRFRHSMVHLVVNFKRRNDGGVFLGATKPYHVIRHDRDVGKQFRAGGACNRQRSQPASPDMFDRVGDRVEHGLDVSAKQIGDQWLSAPILHYWEVETGLHLEGTSKNSDLREFVRV